MADYLVHEVTSADTLRGLAIRYLGDHRRWVDIVASNSLTAEQYSLQGIKQLLIPTGATSQFSSTDTNVYRTDLAVQDGGLVLGSTPGLVLVTGRENLKAALLRALVTELGDLQWHQRYGLLLEGRVGMANGRILLRLIKVDAERVIRRDDRVADVTNITVVQIPGERRIGIGARVIDVLGNELTLSTERSFR